MRYPRDLVPSDFAIKHWVLNESGVRKIHICAISNPAGVVLGIGHAICSPEDAYDSERGREIAQGRAIKAWSGHNGMRKVELGGVFDELEETAERDYAKLGEAAASKKPYGEALLGKLDEIYAFPAVLDDGSRNRLS